MKPIKWAVNTMPKTADEHLAVMGLENVAAAKNFHKSFTKKEGRQGNTANFAAETCQAPVNLL